MNAAKKSLNISDPTAEFVDNTPSKKKPDPVKRSRLTCDIPEGIHKALKLAALTNDQEMRDIVAEALEANPKVAAALAAMAAKK
ncbi:hypothetical protein [Nocardia nova]